MIIGVALFNPENEMLVTMPKPNRHNDVIEALYKATGRPVRTEWKQGFVTDSGKFLTRGQAAAYVREISQPLTEYAKAEYENKTLTTLCSEDLW